MTKLAEAVRRRIVEVSEGEVNRSAALARAEELADLYAYVVPETYVLPLDAMAGFAAPSGASSPNLDEVVDVTA